MKKIILSVAAVFAFGFASAQNLVSSKGEEYLPKAGEWSIGFNANGVLNYFGGLFSNGGRDGENLVSGQKTFLGRDNSISLVGKRMTSDNTADRYVANFNLNIEKVKDVDATTVFGTTVGYGKEWRRGSTRLQGYYGADALVNIQYPAKKQFELGLGVQGFVGAEYFVMPKFAIGAQYTYGVSLVYKNDGNLDTNSFGFNIGDKQTGLGILSATLNLYF